MYSVASKATLSNLGYLYCTYSKYASNPMMHTHGMSQVNLTLSDRFISIQCTFLNSCVFHNFLSHGCLASVVTWLPVV